MDDSELKLNRLKKGETFITSDKGNSLYPILKSGQDHLITPTTWESVNVGDIVYCKISNPGPFNFFTFLVKSKSVDKGCLVGGVGNENNFWTKEIYGKILIGYHRSNI